MVVYQRCKRHKERGHNKDKRTGRRERPGKNRANGREGGEGREGACTPTARRATAVCKQGAVSRGAVISSRHGHPPP